MFCSNCGTQIGAGEKFCPNCGTAVAQQDQHRPQQPQQWQQPQHEWQQPMTTGGSMPMKWHKFLIYFALWASGVLNLILGVTVITGAHYGGGYTTKLVYSFYGGLKAVDIIYGLMIVALAAFAIYVRFRLAGFKKNAPRLLFILYIAAAVSSLLYVIAVSAAIGGSVGDISLGSNIFSLILSVVMVVLNNIYYDKRSFMFVN